MGPSLATRLAERIHRHGPIPYDDFLEAALYDPESGFYASGRGAGRAGRDFVTSPEVGPLFGTLVARALDRWWAELDHPDPFVVVEAGAGRGVLARDVLAAGPECAPALRYVLVERSASLRARQAELLQLEPAEEELGAFVRGADPDDDTPRPRPGSGPRCCHLDRLPAVHVDGVVLANELLDNLPFRVVTRRASGWDEVRVDVADDGFAEHRVPAPDDLAAEVDALWAEAGRGPAPEGLRLPVARTMTDWLVDACGVLRRGRVVAIDYAVTLAEIEERSVDDPGSWLRAYRDHRRVASPLDAPGTCDITADVVVEQWARAVRRAGAHAEPPVAQARWLADLGVDDLAAEAAAAWRAQAHVGDLAALRARSLVGEADALCDPAGLGAHRVLSAVVGPAGGSGPSAHR